MSVVTGRVIDLTALESKPDDGWIPHDDHPLRGLYARFGKRLLDISLGLILAILTLPIQIAVMVLSLVLFGRSPIVALPRFGRSDLPFRMLRIPTTPRTTRGIWTWLRLGEGLRRWGLDELPQLWNVVMGQMSLVGPRPFGLDESHELKDWRQHRRWIKPGITGLRQVESRANGGALEDTAYFDIQYIDRLSMGMDVRILARTPSIIGRRDPKSRDRQRGEVLHVRLMLADLSLWFVGVVVATWAHYDLSLSEVSVLGMIAAGALAAVVQLTWAIGNGMYHGRRRLTSPEGLASVAAGAIAVAAILLITAAFVPSFPPSGALLMASAFYLAGALAARSFADFNYSRRARSRHSRTGRLLVFGAGDAGMSAVKTIWADETSPLIPVAFLDDDPKMQRTAVHGLPVLGGRRAIDESARRYNVDTLLIAMPSAHPRDVDTVASIAKAAGLEVQVAPPLAQWLSALLVERAQIPEATYESDTPRSSRGHVAGRERDRGIFDLAIVGLGYVGLPLAMEASRVGLRVSGLDIDVSKVESLNAGKSYVDGISSEELGVALREGFYATNDPSVLALADAITISVPTPLKDGLPDLSAVIVASEAVGDNLRPGQLVVLESTTYPGTTEEVMRPILEARSGLQAGTDFYLAYSPERVDPGNSEYGVHNTPKLLAGIDPASTEQAALLYRRFCPVVEMSGTREAEMAKLLENTYRHINIALINEMAVFCHDLGVDIWETIRGAATKPFGFQAFYPGPGVGGHCIPIDPNYLSYRVRELGKQFRFIELAQEINEFMPQYAVTRALDLLEANGVQASSSRVLILGVAYKPDIADTRETPATAIVRYLRDAGVAVEFSDPHVESFAVDGIEVGRRDDPEIAVSDADLTLIHTPHRELNLTELASAAKLVFDLRGALSGPQHERL